MTHPLRTARCRHNLTIEGLAEEAKVGASTVWRAEHNYPINAESRRRLCTYFGMTSQELGFLKSAEQSASASEKMDYFGEDTHILYDTSQVTRGVHLAMPPHMTLATPERPFSLHEQISVGLVLEATHLATMLDTHWTLDAMLDTLRVVLQGVQGLPMRLRRTLLLETASRVDLAALPIGSHISEEERGQLIDALDKSITLGWQFFHTSSPGQILIVGQTLLYLLQQTQTFLPTDTYCSFCSPLTNLIGSSLYSQGLYDVAQQFHEKAYKAALEGSDIWNQAQSLNWLAIVANAKGHYAQAIQCIETGLHLLADGDSTEDYRRLRAHLLADWAYNASMLGEHALALGKLDASATFLENLEPNAEFDQARWHQLVGDCMLLNRQYAVAVYHLEQSLAQLPPQWITRRILTLLPLARTYAYQQKRDASIAIAEQAVVAIDKIAAPWLKQNFVEYLRLLVDLFPQDKTVRQFITSTQELALLER